MLTGVNFLSLEGLFLLVVVENVLLDPVLNVVLSVALNVLLGDANEVGKESVEHAGNVDAEDDLLLFSVSNEADAIVTSVDLVGLVEPPEVSGVPRGRKSETDNSQNQASSEEYSGAVSLRGEEHDSEGESHNERDAKEGSDKDVPPVNLVIEELVEDLKELADRNKDNCEGDELDTALKREDDAALPFKSGLVLALADAAAAHGHSLGLVGRLDLLDRRESPLRLFSLILGLGPVLTLSRHACYFNIII